MKWNWLIPLLNVDGDIGAASIDATSAEPPSVVVGADAPADGIAPAAASHEEGSLVPDVSQQESFATRLREEKSRIEEQYKPITTHYSQLEQVAKIAGFNDVGEYLTALDEHARQQHAAAEAQRLNVDEETYRQYFAPLNDDLNRTKQELQRLQQSEIERNVRSDYERLKAAHPDFESVRDKVFEIAQQRVLPLEDAYKLVVFDDRVNAAKLAGQQEAISKLSANAQSSPGSLGGDAPNQQFDFTKLSAEDREKYYERAKRGEFRNGLR